MKVSIFGLGYVGCVTAACLAKAKHEIIGVDVVASKAERLGAGKATVVETGIDELIADAHAKGLITATCDGRAAVLASQVSIICVGTPSDLHGDLDLTALRQTARLIGQAMREKADRHVVILRSTVPAGTSEGLVIPTLYRDQCWKDSRKECDLLVVPEFLREGSAIADYYNPPFVVVGSASGKSDHNADVVNALFGDVTRNFHWVQLREAEMLKAVCNGFHALKVAFANEIGALCGGLSINGQSLMAQFVQDRKLNVSPAYLRPGLPFGGSCLPKDLRMVVRLASRAGLDLPLLSSVLPSNEAHLKRAIDRVPKDGCTRIGLNGLAFKAGTDDLRESPIVLIAEHLIGKGYDVRIHDQGIQASLITGANREYIQRHIPHLSQRLVKSIDELIAHSEVILMTRDEEELMEKIAHLEKSPLVIDLHTSAHPLPAASRTAFRDDYEQTPGPWIDGAAVKWDQTDSRLHDQSDRFPATASVPAGSVGS